MAFNSARAEPYVFSKRGNAQDLHLEHTCAISKPEWNEWFLNLLPILKFTPTLLYDCTLKNRPTSI